MNLTPSTVQFDAQGRRCGNGYIAAGKKCRAGAGSAPQKKAKGTNSMARKAARTAGTAAAHAGAAMMGGAMFNFSSTANPARDMARGAALMQAGAGLNRVGQGQGRAGLRQIKTAAIGAALAEAPSLLRGAQKRRLENKRASFERAYRGPSAKRDSVYAAGFAPDLDQLAL